MSPFDAAYTTSDLTNRNYASILIVPFSSYSVLNCLSQNGKAGFSGFVCTTSVFSRREPMKRLDTRNDDNDNDNDNFINKRNKRA